MRLNTTIMRITMRSMLSRKRALLLIPMPLLLIVLTVLCANSSSIATAEWVEVLIGDLGVAVVLPLTALIIGTSVLGSEIEDGTITHILAKPLPRSEIVLSKLVVAFVLTMVTAAVPLGITGAIAGSNSFAVALLVGCTVAALAYSAFFVALSLLTRRPLLVGLIYVLLWESTLSALFKGIRNLSIQQYAISITDRIDNSDLLISDLSVTVAVVMSVVFTVVGTLVASDRLRSFNLTGEAA